MKSTRPLPEADVARPPQRLTQNQLAERWQCATSTLERWRCDGIGPVFLKLQGRVLYRLEDVEAYELKHLRRSPGQSVQAGGAA